MTRFRPLLGTKLDFLEVLSCCGVCLGSVCDMIDPCTRQKQTCCVYPCSIINVIIASFSNDKECQFSSQPNSLTIAKDDLKYLHVFCKIKHIQNQIFNANYASEDILDIFVNIDAAKYLILNKTSSNKNFEVFVIPSSFLTP